MADWTKTSGHVLTFGIPIISRYLINTSKLWYEFRGFRHRPEWSSTTERILKKLKSFLWLCLLDQFQYYSPKPFFFYDVNPKNIKTIFIPSNVTRRKIIKSRNSSPVHQSNHISRPSYLTYSKCASTLFNFFPVFPPPPPYIGTISSTV